MVGAIGLLEADHSLLSRPVQRQADMRGEFQIGQFSTLGDRLDDFRREKRQPDEAGNVAISYALATGDRGQRSRPGGNEFLEPPMGPCDRLEQRSECRGVMRSSMWWPPDRASECLHVAIQGHELRSDVRRRARHVHRS